MKKLLYLLLLLFSAMFFFSCEEEFTPYVNGDNTWMFFCVLDNRSDTQFAFLQRSYKYNEVKKMPKNIKIILSEDGGKYYVFKDTILPGFDAYSCSYLKGMKPEYGKHYKFSVAADSLPTQYSKLTYFPKVTTRFIDTVIVDVVYREKDEKNERVILGSRNRDVFAVDVSKDEGFFGDARLYIDYDLRYGSQIVSGRSEVPVALTGDPELFYEYGSDLNYWKYNFNKVTATYGAKMLYNDAVKQRRIHLFRDYDEIMYAMKFSNPHEIDASKPKPDEVIIKRAYMVFVYIDKNIYFFSRGATDRSIRLDESYYYSNIYTDYGQGYGFVGANGADTLVFKIKPELINILGYKNEQK